MEEENSITLMEMSMMVTGKTIRPMDMVFIFMLTAPSMRESGETISNMVMVLSSGSMEVNTKGNTITQRNMVSDSTYGLMVTNTLANGPIMLFTEKACICGLMAEFIMEDGKTT